MDDKALLALLRKDDPLAMKVIFNHNHILLCNLVFRMVKDTDQAKDIVQDVFLKLWRNRHKIEIEVSLEAYLKRAAINTALNYLESIGRWSKLELNEHDLASFALNSTDREFSFDELSQKASTAIQNLPTRTRTVFTLIRSEEMSYKEVAEALDISIKAVEKEMMKALRLLRESLKDYLNLLSLFWRPTLFESLKYIFIQRGGRAWGNCLIAKTNIQLYENTKRTYVMATIFCCDP
jgi:RNA polymerase sigma-70 factor, ECF subfamily